MSSIRHIALAALLPLVLIACSAGTASSPAGGASSPAAQGTPAPSMAASAKAACDLVTQADVQAALGGTVAAGKAQQIADGDTSCDFGGVLVRVRGGSDAPFLSGIKSSFADAVDIPLVGDAAFYSNQNATFAFVKSGTFVLIQAPNANDRAKLIALATAIAAKL